MRQNEPIVLYAQQEVSKALRIGVLKRMKCEKCGARSKTDAHHEDYRYPLHVTWLCRSCHKIRHNELKKTWGFLAIKILMGEM